MTTRRFIILGAGAIGGVVGAELFKAGIDTLLVDRGAHHDAVKANGLQYIWQDEEVVLPIPIVDNTLKIDFRPDDVVICCTKSQDTASAMESLYRAAPQSIAVVCFQNGVANEGMALRFFPHVYGISVSTPVEHLIPGVVVSFAAPAAGSIRIGHYPHGEDATVHEIAEALDSTRYVAQVFDDVRPWKYAKLLDNLVNPVQALLDPAAGGTISTIAKGEGTAAAIGRRARDEAIAAYDAAGIGYIPLDEFKANMSIVKPGKVRGAERVGASLHQTLTRGLPSVESDYINGEIVMLGRLHGVPTPVNAFLQWISHEAVIRPIQPSSVPEQEFLSWLEQFESQFALA